MMKGLFEMKKILSLVCLAAFVVALGASVGCEEKKTSASGPSNKSVSPASTSTPAKS
jgi:hypothetical protein